MSNKISYSLHQLSVGDIVHGKIGVDYEVVKTLGWVDAGKYSGYFKVELKRKKHL